MKTIIHNSIAVFSLFICFISCKAQTLPLNTALNNIPNNAYVKDLDNQLAPFIGTYKANSQGKEIILIITKIDNKLEIRSKKQFFRDALIVKYIVKNSLGQILQDTTNDDSVEFYSIDFSAGQNKVGFYYGGTNCGVGWGDVDLKKINSTQLSWAYYPDDTIINSNKCPSGTDINIYLPQTKDLLFTKQ